MPPLGVHGCKPLDAFIGLEGLSPRFAKCGSAGRVRAEEGTPMDSALHSTLPRPELVTDASTLAAGRTVPRALTATAIYGLSEAGRKASLLAGGNGRAVQQIHVQVPANRLHLVQVSARGIARLKLRPRFALDGQERIVSHDTPPTYDSPPTIEELLREAARNHELERAYYAQSTASRGKNRELDREWRSQVALAFLADQTERALPHPPVTPNYCYLATERGAVRFATDLDHGPARDVPTEAYRRFRADVEVARERRHREREEKVQAHEEKKQTIGAWIAEHGTADALFSSPQTPECRDFLARILRY